MVTFAHVCGLGTQDGHNGYAEATGGSEMQFTLKIVSAKLTQSTSKDADPVPVYVTVTIRFGPTKFAAGMP